MIALVPGVSTMWMSRRIGDRGGDDVQCGLADLPIGGLAVLQHVDLRRRRRHALFDDPAADQRVDEGALAGVELADDHQQEQLVELLDRLLERGLMFGRGVEPRERDAEAGEDPPLLLEQLVLVGREELGQHRGYQVQYTGQNSGLAASGFGFGCGFGGVSASVRLSVDGSASAARLQSVCGAWFSTIQP